MLFWGVSALPESSPPEVEVAEVSGDPDESLARAFGWGGYLTGEPFDEYLKELSRANWLHFSVSWRGAPSALVSFDCVERGVWSVHVSARRHSIPPRELRRVLLALAASAFECGALVIVTGVPEENRAARRLALACGMRPGAVFTHADGSRERAFALWRGAFQHGQQDEERTTPVQPADDLRLPDAA
jgi:hypothetical protein